jgi:hypothetical protein
MLFARNRIHFNWGVFVAQIRLAAWGRFAIGIALVWVAYLVRAIRWSVFVSPTKKVSWLKLLGPQVMGFTGVALLGRPADLVRPYLVSRKVRLTLSSQVAVYVVERMFDAGAMALLFSTVLFFAPDRGSLPHPELLKRIALTGLIGTAGLAIMAVAVRLSGNVLAAGTRKALSGIAPKLGEGVAHKILAFRDGLQVLSSAKEVASAIVLSLLMWGMISFAYLETAHAFVRSTPLAGMTFAGCMVMMAASMGSSAIQLPVIGWFTQIGLVAAALQGLFHVATETALGCASMLLIVTFLSIVPVGLVWSRFEHVSLRKIAEESEHAGEPETPGSSMQAVAEEPELIPEA